MSGPFDRGLSAEPAEGLSRDFAVSAGAGDEERVVESALRGLAVGGPASAGGRSP